MDTTALKATQAAMPWTSLWSADYLADPRSYKDLQHCLINIVAKAGAILQRIEVADHHGEAAAHAINRDEDATALAYIVMSAMKAANIHPQGKIELADYIAADLNRRKGQ